MPGNPRLRARLQMNFNYNLTNINLVRSFKPLDVNTVDGVEATEALYDQQATMQPALAVLSAILTAFSNTSKVYDPSVILSLIHI